MAKFVKGQSGNPGGRPKEDPEVKVLAKKHCRAAIARLVFWMESDNPKASVSASMALLDRGFGKPAQSVDITNSDGSMSAAWMAALKAVDGVEVVEAPVQH